MLHSVDSGLPLRDVLSRPPAPFLHRLIADRHVSRIALHGTTCAGEKKRRFRRG
ncbi:MAG: hypothetical protein KDJ39_14455 [Gammaproteobacteria bacterium]|nr:hypothetical protein [Gammaproteobacteria bacterium]